MGQNRRRSAKRAVIRAARSALDAVRLPALPRDRKWFRDGPFTFFGACFTVLPCLDRCRFLRAAGWVRGREAPAQRRRRRP